MQTILKTTLSCLDWLSPKAGNGIKETQTLDLQSLPQPAAIFSHSISFSLVSLFHNESLVDTPVLHSSQRNICASQMKCYLNLPPLA